MRSFQFTEPFGDARVAELKLLSWAAQMGKLDLPSVPVGPWHDLLTFLVWNDCLTAFSYDNAIEYWNEKYPERVVKHNGLVDSHGMPGDSLLERSVTLQRLNVAEALYKRESVIVRLTHMGRVRLSELKQALRSGREREPFGILWDVRHWEQDLQIAVLDANPESPLAVAFLDMNGLKQVNDKYGHNVGDTALKTYFSINRRRNWRSRSSVPTRRR